MTVPFQEAIDFFRAKTNVGTRAWTDLWQGQHAPAFSVAGAMNAGLLTDLRAAVDKAIADGTTLETFKRDFRKAVKTHGWTGWAGEGSRAGEAWRAGVIFNTNLRMAYNAGRFRRAQDLKASRPYLRYVAVMDSQTRPQHRAWHNTVLPVDDAWWNTHHPPNGWGCRCTVQSLASRDLRSLGLQVTDEAPPLNAETVTVNTPDGPVQVEQPQGIDKGFAYNPGRAGAATDLAREAGGQWQPTPTLRADASEARPALPAVAPQRAPAARIEQPTEASLQRALRQVIGGDTRDYVDPVGMVQRIDTGLAAKLAANKRTLFDHRERWFPLIPELIQQPQEVWVGFERNTETGRYRMRRRYFKNFALEGAEAGRLGVLIGEAVEGNWRLFSFLMRNDADYAAARTGRLIYRDPALGLPAPRQPAAPVNRGDA
ncbi:phage minor head protein [Ferrovibrio sp.]|uniref:phage minor head protein n=1 Tax=Ferrovibrio sp. TaxID=1917215 RepID=UPI0035B042FC